MTVGFCFAKIDSMNVFGHITDYTNLPEARNAVRNMQSGQENPYGWLGFYQERGENVSAVGTHREWRKVLFCGWEWRCQPMPARLPDHPEPWELCGYTWLCHWAWDRVTIADTFAYSARRLEMEIVNHHTDTSYDFGTFDILELRDYGGFGTWFAVCRHWGFATRIGDNLFKIF